MTLVEIPPRFAADACPRCLGGRLFPDLDGAVCINCGYLVWPAALLPFVISHRQPRMPQRVEEIKR